MISDLLEIIITNILGFLTWFYERLKVVNPLDIIIAIVVGYVAWYYDRGRRYNYLADRWNVLMNMNADMPVFFDPEKTKEYENWPDGIKIKYHQFARMCWGFVEDVIRNDYFWEIWTESYIKDYEDTILDFISLHHAWLRNNTKFFNYPKFSKILKKRFGEQIRKQDSELYKWVSIKNS